MEISLCNSVPPLCYYYYYTESHREGTENHRVLYPIQLIPNS